MFQMKAKVKMGDLEFYYEKLDAQTLMELYSDFIRETKLKIEQHLDKELTE